ncbi:hypothetical protein H4S07_004628, partial [Coemansia furcata]
ECLRLAQEDELQGNDGSSGRQSRVATPGGVARTSSEALLKTKENIRAQEAAIARLKMEISRKQTKILLRKKLYESKLKRAHTEAASAPATPYVESGNASPELLAADSPALDDSAPSPTSASSGSGATPDTHGDVAKRARRRRHHRSARGSHDDDGAGAASGESPPMDVGDSSGDEALALPECGACEQMIVQAPAEVRSAHISNIMALLKGAIQSKNSELRSIMRGAGAVSQSDLEKLRVAARQIDERLGARKAALEEQRGAVGRRIGELQAEMGLVDMELGILAYSQAANRGYRAMVDPATSERASFAAASGGRAVGLRSEITAVHQFMDAMFRAADTSVEATASDSDLALHASRLALVPASLHTSAPPQRELGALRAKLVAMKQEQDSMAQKLAHLAEKRRGSESAPLPAPAAKRPRVSAASSASDTPLPSAAAAASPSYTTSIAALLAAAARAVAMHGEQAALKWRNLLRLPADECIVQQLVVVDGVGVQCVTSLSEGVLSGITSSEPAKARPAPAQQPAAGAFGTVTAPAYVPYESPFGSTAGAGTSARVQSSEADLSEQSVVDDSVDLSRVNTANLFGLVRTLPESNPRVVAQFHADIAQALGAVAQAADGTAPNEAIARALLPVVAGYRRMIPKMPMSKSCALSRALKTDALSKVSGPFVRFAGGTDSEVLQINDISNLKRFVAEVAGFAPILNRDVARMSYSALAMRLQRRQKGRHHAAAPLRRYFDVGAAGGSPAAAPGSASDDDDDDEPELVVGAAERSGAQVEGVEAGQISGDDDDAGGESETEAVSAGDDGPDVRYRRALRRLWSGCPITGAHINETHVLSYLHSAANKSLGKALVYLKQSLQLYPRSEKLWDLCLELFARQPVAAQEVMAAFHDATKFNPQSACLWQRYMHWCL